MKAARGRRPGRHESLAIPGQTRPGRKRRRSRASSSWLFARRSDNRIPGDHVRRAGLRPFTAEVCNSVFQLCRGTSNLRSTRPVGDPYPGTTSEAKSEPTGWSPLCIGPNIARRVLWNHRRSDLSKKKPKSCPLLRGRCYNASGRWLRAGDREEERKKRVYSVTQGGSSMSPGSEIGPRHASRWPCCPWPA